MYPISFDNPNGKKDRPKAANHNIDDITVADVAESVLVSPETDPERVPEIALDGPSENTEESQVSADPAANSLLVVECRSDDKWRVVLCTDLSELDGALDTARALRGSPDVDEVCLTLEMSGSHGRESRREVLRFTPEMLETAAVPVAAPHQTPVQAAQAQPVPCAPLSEPVSAAGLDDSGYALLSAALKTPDYDMEELDFSEFAMPPADTPIARDLQKLGRDWAGEVQEGETDPDRVRYEAEEPIDFGALTGSAKINADREAARQMLASIYAADLDDEGMSDLPGGDDKAIRVEIPLARRDHADWLYRTQPYSGPLRGTSSRLEAEDDDAIDKLEMPFLAQKNGLATKLLVFAGSLALLVLGGALAELLAVDITTTANAGVGAFDTFAQSSGLLNR